MVSLSLFRIAVLLLSSSLVVSSSPILGDGISKGSPTAQGSELGSTLQLEKRGNWQDFKSIFVKPIVEPTVEKYQIKENNYKAHLMASRHFYRPQEINVPSHLNHATDATKYNQLKYLSQGTHFGEKVHKNMFNKMILEENNVEGIHRQIEHKRQRAIEEADKAKLELKKAKEAKSWRRIWESEAAGKQGIVKGERPPSQHTRDDYITTAIQHGHGLPAFQEELVHGHRDARKHVEIQQLNYLKANALATNSKRDARKIAREYLQQQVAHQDRAKEYLERSKLYNAKKRGWKKALSKAEKNQQEKRQIESRLLQRNTSPFFQSA